jgi:Immunity protein 26
MAHPAVGTFLAIPLSDGSFGYGRAKRVPYLALYDLRTDEPITDLDRIEASGVAFTVAFRRLRGGDSWEEIGVRPLAGAVAEPAVRFMQDLGDPRQCVILDEVGNERAATPEECVGLERAAVWETYQVEERLLDTFEGRPNETSQQLQVRLPGDLG